MVLPNDLDINLHMNNGRYLTICDLNRLDFFIRTGLFATMMQKKWIAVVSEHTMNYKRALNLFNRFTVSMTLTSWDDKAFYMTHEFKAGHRIIAQGTSRGVIRGKEGVIAPEEVIRAVVAYRAKHPKKFPHVEQ
jgi:acyl-CoA thioesterase FadM